VFTVIFLDAQNRLISIKEMFRGTVTQTSVYPREVVKEALGINAAAAILAHKPKQPRNCSYLDSRSAANRAAASRLPSFLSAAIAGRFFGRGRTSPLSQLYTDCPDAPTKSP
jgi:hypothetical protein